MRSRTGTTAGRAADEPARELEQLQDDEPGAVSRPGAADQVVDRLVAALPAAAAPGGHRSNAGPRRRALMNHTASPPSRPLGPCRDAGACWGRAVRISSQHADQVLVDDDGRLSMATADRTGRRRTARRWCRRRGVEHLPHRVSPAARDQGHAGGAEAVLAADRSGIIAARGGAASGELILYRSSPRKVGLVSSGRRSSVCSPS